MSTEINALVAGAREIILAATNLKALEQIRVNYLGKQGKITELMKGLSALSAAERPLYGKLINEAKEAILLLLKERQEHFATLLMNEQLNEQTIDITLPGRRVGAGSLHPVTLVKRRVAAIFMRLGFSLEEGAEIEDDEHNFSALNIPAHHPARQSQDTFYTNQMRGNTPLLLRTHTSSVQIRALERRRSQTEDVTLRMIAMGRVYRRDSDQTHTPMFHQLEGLVLDRSATFADLKGMLTDFIAAFFNKKIALRFRPSYFPFTEPSAEVDIEHLLCAGKGCRVCSHTGWLEVLGCGMVHPNVLSNLNIDSAYRGFAFGVGLDRLAMLYYGIDDLRMLFENDLRFLKQFVR